MLHPPGSSLTQNHPSATKRTIIGGGASWSQKGLTPQILRLPQQQHRLLSSGLAATVDSDLDVALSDILDDGPKNRLADVTPSKESAPAFEEINLDDLLEDKKKVSYCIWLGEASFGKKLFSFSCLCVCMK